MLLLTAFLPDSSNSISLKPQYIRCHNLFPSLTLRFNPHPSWYGVYTLSNPPDSKMSSSVSVTSAISLLILQVDRCLLILHSYRQALTLCSTLPSRGLCAGTLINLVAWKRRSQHHGSFSGTLQAHGGEARHLDAHKAQQQVSSTMDQETLVQVRKPSY